MKALLVQFAAFGAVGVVGTGAHFLVLYLLVSRFGVAPLHASVAGFVAGAITNYALNYVFTFSSSRRHSEALPRFMTVACVGCGINYMIMGALLKTGAHYLIAQGLATGIVLLWNFAGNKLWTFREAK